MTRLRVQGFKNLLDVDIHFGPFTCIAGANGAGKSNLFDAIVFLSHLADKRLEDAAAHIRNEAGKPFDLRSLFYRFGTHYEQTMSFLAEMIIPREGYDDLNQPAKAAITFVTYVLQLGYRIDETHGSLASLYILEERLSQINKGAASKHLKFKHSKKQWRDSVVDGRRTTDFIETETKNGKRIIRVHQDGNAGRPKEILADSLPRTVLSTTNAAENPTALLARREMQSWRLLQLEPSAMRNSDPFTARPVMESNGAHLAATLDYMQRTRPEDHIPDLIAGRVSHLVRDIRSIDIDRDETRQLLTLEVTDHKGTKHPARALSDGTLRFLALSVLEMDARAVGLICFEEPENGIHPERIPAILALLRDIAVDVTSAADEPTNPLRQIIINTHSPSVVGSVSRDNLLFAYEATFIRDGKPLRGLVFKALEESWWCREWSVPTVTLGEVLNYLEPIKDEDLVENAVCQLVLPGMDIWVS